MIKYAKIVDEETKQCEVGLGTNADFYKSIGMTEIEVEQAYNGFWYVKGYVPEKPQAITNAEQIAKLKAKLDDTDWIINKINEAEKFAPDTVADLIEKYRPAIEERMAWRKEINQLENS